VRRVGLRGEREREKGKRGKEGRRETKREREGASSRYRTRLRRRYSETLRDDLVLSSCGEGDEAVLSETKRGKRNLRKEWQRISFQSLERE